VQKDTNQVQLRGTFMQGRDDDLPTMIWLSDLLEPAENFETFFQDKSNRCLDMRNVWLLNYRNMGTSDHHESFAIDVILVISHRCTGNGK
jgi:hypothetical protein